MAESTKRKRSAHLSTKAWMLRGIGSVPGMLKLSKGRLSFTAFDSGTLGKRKLRKLEADAGQEGLAILLDKGRKALVFDVALTEIEAITFPWYYFSGGFKLRIKGARYRFGFDEPANTMIAGDISDHFAEASKARRHGKTWKAALNEHIQGHAA